MTSNKMQRVIATDDQNGLTQLQNKDLGQLCMIKMHLHNFKSVTSRTKITRFMIKIILHDLIQRFMAMPISLETKGFTSFREFVRFLFKMNCATWTFTTKNQAHMIQNQNGPNFKTKTSRTELAR